MNIQDILHKTQKLREITEQNELQHCHHRLDAIGQFVETQHAIVSVIGSVASGKCTLINALVGTDMLPTSMFKSRALYKIQTGKSAPRLCSLNGQSIPLASFSDISKYSKRDYDLIACLQSETGIFQHNIELRTGYDIDKDCPVLEYLLSDVVVFCIKATALFSIDEKQLLEDLKKNGHSNVIICITHLNNVKKSELGNVIEYVKEKHLDYPVVYFKSDTTGEKDFEEFYVPGEKLNMERFSALGVIEETVRRPMEEVDSFFTELEGIFQKDDFTKAEIVEALKKFLPNFEHEEKGKNLDQKM